MIKKLKKSQLLEKQLMKKLFMEDKGLFLLEFTII